MTSRSVQGKSRNVRRRTLCAGGALSGHASRTLGALKLAPSAYPAEPRRRISLSDSLPIYSGQRSAVSGGRRVGEAAQRREASSLAPGNGPGYALVGARNRMSEQT